MVIYLLAWVLVAHRLVLEVALVPALALALAVYFTLARRLPVLLLLAAPDGHRGLAEGLKGSPRFTPAVELDPITRRIVRRVLRLRMRWIHTKIDSATATCRHG